MAALNIATVVAILIYISYVDCNGRGMKTSFDDRDKCGWTKSKKFPYKDDCRRYWDCSVGMEKKMCPYPKLFSVHSNSCEDYKKVKCGSRSNRYFLRHLACKKSKSKTIPDPNNCRRFWECSGSSIIYYQCTYPGLFSTRSNSCRYHKHVQCGSRSKTDFKGLHYCKTRKSKTLPNTKYCHKYYECKKGSVVTPQMCRYPQLYSTQSNSCEDFKKVRCGSRKEYKTKCQYENRYRLTCYRCVPCEIKNPDCDGYPDGVNINRVKGHRFYVVCDQGRTIGQGAFGRCTQDVNKRYSNGQCGNYIWCYYGRKYTYKCPAGTVFDEKRGSCQHAYDTCKPCGTRYC